MSADVDERVLALVDLLTGQPAQEDREQALRQLHQEAAQAAVLRRRLAEQQQELQTALGVLRYLAANDRHVAGLLSGLSDRAENYILDEVLPDVWPDGSLADSAQDVADQLTNDLAQAQPPGTPVYASVPSRTTPEAREAQEDDVRQQIAGGGDAQSRKRLVHPLPDVDESSEDGGESQ